MATSGTVGATVVEVAQMIDEAVRRCGVLPQSLTPENVELVTTNLYMVLSNLSNRGVNLWRVDRPLIPIYPGQTDYTLATGTVDILEAVYRMPQRLEADTVTSAAGGTVANLTDGDVDTATTQLSTNGNYEFDFGADNEQTVAMVGMLPNATATYTLVFEYSADGATWSTAYAPGAVSYTDNRWQWYAIEPAYEARYFRVRESGGATLDFREAYLCAQWSDITMYRMNRDDYFSLPNKRFPAQQPPQFWFDRQLTPKIVLWPAPQSTFYLLYLMTHRHIEDVGAISNTLDIPQRWVMAIICNAAYMILPSLPGADLKRADLLKAQADYSMMNAEDEERDRSPIYLSPNISAYTR